MISLTGFKYCPKCASTMIHEHTANSMKCDTCGYTYFHNAAAAVGGIVLYKDQIVLLRRGHDPMKGMLDVPGGFVDYNESAEEALLREIREEMNMEVDNTEYFGSAYNKYEYKNVSYFTCDIFYKVKINTTAAFKPIDEVTELLLVKPSELILSQVAFVSVRSMLEKYCKSILK